MRRFRWLAEAWDLAIGLTMALLVIALLFVLFGFWLAGNLRAEP